MEQSRPWTRAPRIISTVFVAGIAGYASYWHQVAVALAAGERWEIAHAIPISVDGMLIVAATFMVEDRARGRKPRAWAVLGFWIGTIASVSANLASAQPTARGYVVAAWPAIALLLVVEMWSRKGKLILDDAAELAAPTREAAAIATPAIEASVPRQRGRRKPRYLPAS